MTLLYYLKPHYDLHDAGADFDGGAYREALKARRPRVEIGDPKNEKLRRFIDEAAFLGLDEAEALLLFMLAEE